MNRKLLIFFGLILGAGVLVTGCGGDSAASQEEIQAARKQGAVRAQQQARIHDIQRELKEVRRGQKEPGADERTDVTDDNSGVAPAPEGGSSGNCGGGLSAGAYTTCGFAEEVEADYYAEISPGSGTVNSYSPTTGSVYSMYCTAGSPHTCTGGNDASVSFP